MIAPPIGPNKASPALPAIILAPDLAACLTATPLNDLAVCFNAGAAKATLAPVKPTSQASGPLELTSY